MKMLLSQAVAYLSNPRNLRAVLKRVRRMLVVATAVVDVLIRDEVKDLVVT